MKIHEFGGVDQPKYILKSFRTKKDWVNRNDTKCKFSLPAWSVLTKDLKIQNILTLAILMLSKSEENQDLP